MVQQALGSPIFLTTRNSDGGESIAYEVQIRSFLKVRELNMTTLKYYVTGTDGSFLIGLLRGTSTCTIYDIDKFPCAYILASFNDSPNNMHNLCSKYYTKELWVLTYVQTTYPIPKSS